MILRAIDIHRSHSISFLDALVVHCAVAGRFPLLMSEDLNSGQVIESLRIKNPFFG